MLGENRSELSADWGFDHGTWSVLHWTNPKADAPVIHDHTLVAVLQQRHTPALRTAWI